MGWICNIIFISLFCFSTIYCADPFNDGSTSEEKHEFKGVHFIASYSGCDHDALTNMEILASIMEKAVKECGATMLDSCKYVFHPDAITMVILLSESHASIHTYPEYGACFVDLFTCGNKCSFEKFDMVLRNYLKPTEVNQKVLIRHQGIEEKNYDVQ